MQDTLNLYWNNPIILLAHLALSILLFYIVNWLGYKSMSMGLGYDTVSLFQREEDDAPAFNYVLRVLSPLIFLIVVSSVFYYLGMDILVYKIYMVSGFYVLYRIIIIHLIGRGLLTNWTKHSIYICSILLLTVILYKNILIQKKNVLPDWSTLSNELWIIIFVFLYMVFNKIKFRTNGTQKRRNRYIKHRYNKFTKKYGDIVNAKVTNDKLKALIYSIMVVEDFNRYFIARLVENISFFLTRKNRTLGIMQVNTDVFISSKKSVELGTDKIVTTYKELLNKREYYGDLDLKEDLIYRYNPNRHYIDDTLRMTYEIEDLYYPNTTDVLVENPIRYDSTKALSIENDFKKDESKF